MSIARAIDGTRLLCAKIALAQYCQLVFLCNVNIARNDSPFVVIVLMLSNPEIAEIMGLSIEVFESLTARGKRKLIEILQTQKWKIDCDGIHNKTHIWIPFKKRSLSNFF